MEEINNDGFLKLTPINNVELGVYEKAIDFAFQNDDLRNIAISGAYCSGKSSVLETYKKKHPDKKFIHASLAHFPAGDNSQTTDGKNKEKDSKETQISVLEGKIVNQLVHQIPASQIPQTRFRIKRKISTGKLIFHVVLLCILLLTFAYFWSDNAWNDYVEALSSSPLRQLLICTTYEGAPFVFGCIMIAILAYGLVQLIRLQHNKDLMHKLSIQGNEIEIFEKFEDSNFDKYMNEVLYLLKNSGVDAIIFEDLDRFNTRLIFEHLRELNALVNAKIEQEDRSQKQQSSETEKKSLKFFYMLRDDMFESKDRVKFFDFIIPVVPVIDGSNSYTKLKNQFESMGISEKKEDSKEKSGLTYDDEFLRGISIYISDMRILKNICNELMVYYQLLKETEPDFNKMMAIITYKNLFPKDFNDLQAGCGFMYTLFAKKNELGDKQKMILQGKISQLRGEISQLEQNPRQNNRELSEKKEQLAKAEKELKISNENRLRQYLTRENIDEYFSELFSENVVGERNEFREVKGNENFGLLKYLIWNGYVDETYSDYMTYFYNGGFKLNDKKFLRSITDMKAKEYSFQLENPEQVARWLRLQDFDQPETLNFDLLEALLQ